MNLYTLTNANGLVLKITDYGATITEFWLPDRKGKLADVVLGYDSLDDYTKGDKYFGAIVGRVANRIRFGKFKLDEHDYQVVLSEGPHHLHGGLQGWDKVIWSAEPVESPEGSALRLTYVSKDGEQGYPGAVTAKATYVLTERNELKLEMEATTDRPTIVNMAHHSYWNLAGHESGSIADHELTLFADKYTPGDPGDPMIPTGVVKPVEGTPFDFRSPKVVGKDLKAAGGTPIGFDHNLVVNGDPHALRRVARLQDPKSGRVMTLEADQPGVQLYSGNFLNGKDKGKGAVYHQYAGLCLETQKFPNSINIPAWSEEEILRPGQHYKHTMIYRFTAE